MEADQELSNLLKVVTRAIVDFPDDISVTVVHSGATVVLELAVAREDVGKVIGRGGAMAGVRRWKCERDSDAAEQLERLLAWQPRQVLEFMGK